MVNPMTTTDLAAALLRDVPKELLAKIIYEAMRYERRDTTPDWVPNGNAFAQDEARRAVAIAMSEVRAALTAALAPTDAAHVNETPKSEHDGADVLTDAQAPFRMEDMTLADLMRDPLYEAATNSDTPAAQAREAALRSLASFVSGMDESTFFSFANDMDRAFETHRATEASNRILALIGEART